MLPPIDEITENFALLDDGSEQFEYLIELGRMMPPFPEDKRTDDRLVQGCQSRVWLEMDVAGTGQDSVMTIQADSDAHITKGLVALLIALHSGHTVADILQTDASAIIRELGLGQHITSKRSSGLRSMIDQVRREAARAAAAT